MIYKIIPNVSIITEDGTINDSKVDFSENNGLEVSLTAKKDFVKYIKLRWNIEMPSDARFLGDAWERGYGDLEWRGFVADRAMPWYFLISFNENTTIGIGVKVRPNALCCWNADEQGITLLLDVRNGGNGVHLNGRTLKLATIVEKSYHNITEYSAACDFCGVMCDDPILPPNPVYGGNNWYYAYGNSSHEEILEDAAFIANLSQGLKNRPYMVIDDGWSPNMTKGPWEYGNERFPDMSLLAKKISDLNVIPGIWIRYLCDKSENIPEKMFLRQKYGHLDPSNPDVLKKVADDTKRLTKWGYKLIKHDFSTFDIFGGWGRNAGNFLCDDGWSFFDNTKTSAEIIINFYKTILENAGNSLILGCNCIGHLCAGLVHLNRIGDDTSGIIWERTKKMGINTLAFRHCQNKKFFDIDADCVGITEKIPWKYNKQWLQLLSMSGSPLFVSVKRTNLEKECVADLKKAFAINSVQEDTFQPLDWKNSTTPRLFLINGKEKKFNWNGKCGIEKYI